jgi:DNA polymerase mu
LSASVHHSRLIHAPITYNRTDQALVVWQQPDQTIHRRLDIVVAPWHQYHPAILAWTGSKHFEQSLRLFAKKKRFKVTHHGIFCRSTGNLIPVHSEREAFNVLGLQFLEPDKRNF